MAFLKGKTMLDPQIPAFFFPEEEILSCTPFGNGHIHDSYDLETREGRFLLQRFNTHVFPHPGEVMDNIARITQYLARECRDLGEDPSRRVLELIPSLSGDLYIQPADGSVYRVYRFVSGCLNPEKPESAEDCFACGKAFGDFQYRLRSFPAESLFTTIPDFHNTPRRYEALLQAARVDRCKRAAEVTEELRFFSDREAFYPVLEKAHAEGRLPLRVTHNDAKINNCMLDEKTRQPMCVLDLDTVMPGYCVNDFGEAVRTGAVTAAEDARDPRDVSLRPEYYRAYREGFLSGCRDILTEDEIRLLPEAARIMTLENGIRFLTDYLDGDRYFKTDYPGHNLVRAHTQIALAESMERQWKDL